jgi:hypothetical protein
MGTPQSGAYSFQDVTAGITGPGINISFTGAAEEGYTIEMEGDKGTLSVGAGGDGMHSVSGRQSGTITFRLQKTSTSNQQLGNGYDYQTGSAAYYGQNTILIEDPIRGDSVTGTGCGYRRFPNLTYGSQGNTQEWAFNCTRIVSKLGPGVGQIASS